jgi:hypothetical protein
VSAANARRATRPHSQDYAITDTVKSFKARSEVIGRWECSITEDEAVGCRSRPSADRARTTAQPVVLLSRTRSARNVKLECCLAVPGMSKGLCKWSMIRLGDLTHILCMLTVRWALALDPGCMCMRAGDCIRECASWGGAHVRAWVQEHVLHKWPACGAVSTPSSVAC